MQQASSSNTMKQFMLQLTNDSALRGITTAERGFETSILHFIEKACKYKPGSSSARVEWAHIRGRAANPDAPFHNEAACVVSGTAQTCL